MRNNLEVFEKEFNKNFPDVEKTTLSKIKNGKLRIELGGSLKNTDKRIEQAKVRINEILKFCFYKKKIWIHIILWGESEKGNLIRAGLNLELADLVIEENTPDTNVLVIYAESYSEELLKPIIISKLNNELARYPFADITFYIIDFDTKLIVNIYDDRGMDIYSKNEKYIENIASKFHKWRLQKQ